MRVLLFFSLFSLSVLAKQPLVHNHIEMLGDEYNNGYPESKYHEVLDLFQKIYGERIKKLGGELHILRDFSDGAVNAWAWRIGKEYHLEIPGGMSKYHLINEEAFIMTICHELGHLLGGAPIKGNIGEISSEGQSDYFASTHCMKRMLPLVKPFKELEKDSEIELLCKDQICKRVLAGAKSVANYFAFLEGSKSPSLLKEDTRVANRTLDSHPKAQCRLDTMKRGYFCKNKNEDHISNIDIKKAYCHLKDQKENSRPKCWFKI